jgi:hypothetical protein
VADFVCTELSEVHAAAESFQDAAVAQVSGVTCNVAIAISIASHDAALSLL